MKKRFFIVMFALLLAGGQVMAADKAMSEAVNDSIRALNSDAQNVRAEAARQLGMRKNRDSRALPYLIRALQDESAIVRMSAADSIGSYKDKSATQVLLDTLEKEKEASVRRTIVSALHYLRDKKSIEPLLEVFSREKDESVKLNIIQVLDKRFRAKEALDEFILALKKDKSARIRSAVAEALGNIGDPVAYDALVKALSDKSDDVIMNAAEALGKLGNKKAIEEITAVLSSKYPRTRCVAASALGKLGNEGGFDIALKEVGHKDFRIRVVAIEALGNIGKVTEDVEKVLQDAYNYDKGRGVKYTVETAASKLKLKLVEEKEPVENKEQTK